MTTPHVEAVEATKQWYGDAPFSPAEQSRFTTLVNAAIETAHKRLNEAAQPIVAAEVAADIERRAWEMGLIRLLNDADGECSAIEHGRPPNKQMCRSISTRCRSLLVPTGTALAGKEPSRGVPKSIVEQMMKEAAP